jgi:hypothetical protein
MIRLELGTLGIIEGDQKRLLEEYVDERCFKQRKSYDEYYVTTTNIEANLDLGLLMIIAEKFRVVVCEDAVIIGQYKNR